MKIMYVKIIALMYLCLDVPVDGVTFSSSTDVSSNTHQTVTITCKLEDNESILANSIHASIDNPSIMIQSISMNQPSIKKYVPEFKQKKRIYEHDFQIIIDLEIVNIHSLINAMLHISYLSTKESAILDLQIPIEFLSHSAEDELNNELVHKSSMPTPHQVPVQKNESWTSSMQNMVEKSTSSWMQLLFALLLGLLLSLTPCIYPMIPITIGILHSQGRKSLLSDFLGSLCYASGLATTFACLGLLATVAGSSFGSLLSHPPFVIALVLFIGYMSLTMIGIIDMYIPSFMKGEVKLYRHLGPFFAAYLFGAISGTIASPCVSPGLALLLSIVATLGNKILGFFLLFAFGIGLSIPLVIIGTFSNALYLLPKSGIWMVEIKKGLGFFMMATCFYYLSNIFPAYIVAWLSTLFTLFTALFYLIESEKHHIIYYKRLYIFIGMIMIGVTMVMITSSYEKTFYRASEKNNVYSVVWQNNYHQALDLAQKENKLLLVDFWAHHCTLCKAIDKKVFHNQTFIEQIRNKVIFVKIDATNSNNPEYLRLKEQYKIYAQPTIILVNPHNESILKKWASEPYSMKIEDCIQQIDDTIKKLHSL